jgi:hypothetical protein
MLKNIVGYRHNMISLPSISGKILNIELKNSSESISGVSHVKVGLQKEERRID